MFKLFVIAAILAFAAANPAPAPAPAPAPGPVAKPGAILASTYAYAAAPSSYIAPAAPIYNSYAALYPYNYNYNYALPYPYRPAAGILL